MSKMEGITPLPWFAVNCGTKAQPMMSVMAERISGRGPTHEVALCATGDSIQEMENANAAYIVHACNSYPALVEALENLTRDCMASDFNEHWDRFKKAEALLSSLNGDKK